MEDRQQIAQALDEFTKRTSDEIPTVLETYLVHVAKTGETIFEWPLLKPLFLQKLAQVVDKFLDAVPCDNLPILPNVENLKLHEVQDRIVTCVNRFSGVPFTIQRLCELVTEPDKHYKRPDKFLRGVERNVLIVSSVDTLGNKIVNERRTVNGIGASGTEASKETPDTAPLESPFMPPPNSPDFNSPSNVVGLGIFMQNSSPGSWHPNSPVDSPHRIQFPSLLSRSPAAGMPFIRGTAGAAGSGGLPELALPTPAFEASADTTETETTDSTSPPDCPDKAMEDSSSAANGPHEMPDQSGVTNSSPTVTSQARRRSEETEEDGRKDEPSSKRPRLDNGDWKETALATTAEMEQQAEDPPDTSSYASEDIASSHSASTTNEDSTSISTSDTNTESNSEVESVAMATATEEKPDSSVQPAEVSTRQSSGGFEVSAGGDGVSSHDEVSSSDDVVSSDGDGVSSKNGAVYSLDDVSRSEEVNHHLSVENKPIENVSNIMNSEKSSDNTASVDETECEAESDSLTA